MDMEVAIIISGISVAFAFYQGITGNKRNQKADDRSDASQLTTVIVKLENIGAGITEIKSEMTNVKTEMKDDRERIIIIEESTKSAHRRMDSCEKFCKRFVPETEQKN